MSIVPKDSVRFQVALAVLVTIMLSWVLSTGLANYMNYLSIVSVRQEMLKHPQAYAQPIPEPRFGVWDFILGRPPRSMGQIDAGPPAMPDAPPQPGPGVGPEPGGPGPGPGGPAEPPAPLGPRAAMPPPQGAPPPVFFSPMEMKWVVLRLAIALGLAVMAAFWLGRRFTSPLGQLAKGAQEYRARNFEYRVPAKGANEFTAVAAAMNEMADEVSRHIRSLEEDADRRRQFLADVAHELRGPVTTMRTMAGALQDGVADEPERREHAADVLVRTSERMLRLVQDVMELVELDLDRLPVTKTEADLQSLIAASIASHEAEAARAGITLTPLKQGPPVTANVDPDRIAQVLDNIIGNAISYAGAGASVGATLEGGDPVRISIADTGVGIPSRDLPHVLDPFYRVSAARSPGENHIGLGLSIARRMIEAHGGRLTIESREGRGTIVTIVIPKGP